MLSVGTGSVTNVIGRTMEILHKENPYHTATIINDLVKGTHHVNRHWWIDVQTGQPLDVQKLVPEKLMLTVSELAEAMEGHRKDLMDDHLPHRKMLEVELVDAQIRLWDLAGALGLDLGGAYIEKMEYNAKRADHKPEARLAAGGKKY